MLESAHDPSGARRSHWSWVLGVTATLLSSAAARADDGVPPPQPPRTLPYTGNLDADYVILGPVGAAIQIEGAWDSAFGGEIGWLRLRERRGLALVGGAIGAVRYAERDGGRIWGEALVGTRRLPGGLLVGISAGPAVELGTVQHPRAGATGAAWIFAGVVPYLRGGVIDEAGAWIELGLALELPVWRY
jgi:hypothetical protein